VKNKLDTGTMSDQELKATFASIARELGRRGGLARAKKLTKQQRVASARKAGIASGKKRGRL
jgi:hypothetical protein